VFAIGRKILSRTSYFARQRRGFGRFGRQRQRQLFFVHCDNCPHCGKGESPHIAKYNGALFSC
jgi:hypothetical protein